MSDIFNREIMLIGQENFEKLQKANVAVFGLGGVGGACAEALARSGVGRLTLVDNDVVSLSNINRQVIALHSTVGMNKTRVMAQRLLDINSDIEVIERDCFFDSETEHSFDFSSFDYVVDAVDTVTAKLLLVEKCREAGTKIISSMGTGNKINSALLTVTDIYKTSVCPLARVMRSELRKRGIESLKVVYSAEKPIAVSAQCTDLTARRSTPGSMAFVPPAAGLIAAGEVVNDLIR